MKLPKRNNPKLPIGCIISPDQDGKTEILGQTRVRLGLVRRPEWETSA
jgi:hypothetical protein